MTARHARGDGRLAELDLLRFLAALLVLAFHYLVAFASVWGERPSELFPALAPLAGLGILGVELFFMISGFVILMTVWGRGLGSFAWSRFVRLYPAYWLSLAAVVAVTALAAVKGPDARLDAGEYAVNATMVQRLFGVPDANGVYWSLWAELRFYLLMALMVLVGITYRRILAFMACWLAAAAVVEWSPQLGSLLGLEWLAGLETTKLVTEAVMPRYAPYFVAGMALYLIRRHGSAWLPWLMVVAGWVMALHAALERVGGRIAKAGFKAMPVTDAGVIVTITLIFAVMSLVALGLLRLPASRALTGLGGTTYPLYLFHTPVAVALIPALRDAMPPWLLATLTTLAAIGLSYLVYACVERPIQRLLRPRRTPTPPVVTREKAAVP
ncbi:acyltransferase family protein [Thermoactinospora rubra]|uniref:acyltransferase family protein n=1 Tax=Thermoactinospora rubra TaxID=1088767 RepID=UPI000A10B716|nr:acyltransferase [Thermoactinospora rubra]